MNAELLQQELGLEMLEAARLAEEQQAGGLTGHVPPGWAALQSTNVASLSPCCLATSHVLCPEAACGESSLVLSLCVLDVSWLFKFGP